MNKPVLHILLIVIFGLIAYAATFHNSFQFDDSPNIIENPIVKNLRFFTAPSRAEGLPLENAFRSRFVGYLSFALNYQFHGLDVAGYHIVNLAIHILNALLVYWLVLLTFRTPFLGAPHSARNVYIVALFSALLFIAHPVQTQAVTYIIQRFASLATLFCLLSLVSYVRGRLSSLHIPNPERRALRLKPVLWYLSSVISAVLAMKTKEIAFTLPLVVALYEFLFFEGALKKRISHLIPFFLAMLIIPASLIEADKPIGEIIGDVGEVTRLQTAVSRGDYLLTQFRVIVTYLRLLVLPINQSLDYDFPLSHSFFDVEALLSFLFLASLIGLAVYLVRRSRLTSSAWRLTAFGVFWFFITLSVESSVIPIVDVIFEHRVYLPSVGAFIAVTTSTFVMAGKLKEAWPNSEKFAVSALLTATVILAGAAYARNAVWRDEVSLWEDVVKKSPGRARGRTNLGNAYKAGGLIDKAIEQYQAAIRASPDFPLAHSNLANAYKSKGLIEEAIQEYEEALRINPGFAQAHYNLANTYKSMGLVDKAIERYQSALRLDPRFAQAHFNLGITYFEKGSVDEARKEFEAALRIDPRHDKARRFLNYLSR